MSAALRETRSGPQGPHLNPEHHRLPHCGGDPGPRRCLRCRQEFDSAGKGERVCGPCKLAEHYRAGPFVDELTVTR